ncbi:MAG: adenosylcobinamide-GDP ribazoletransferase [Bacteroidales bacterium]|nr:adenosylcobinamide-GDP ribazoletransferase [Bacteroidales bacterium]
MKALAAVMFFTRIPLWKWFSPTKEEYKNLVSYWSMTGWITGGLMSLVFFISYSIFSIETSVIFALISRLILTGALHEDGLADFIDGFGGGTNKEKILSIMKDSHIGSYGVTGLIIYFLLAWSLIFSLGPEKAVIVLFIADPAAKFISSNIINFLPYARKEEDCKSKILYSKMDIKEIAISAFFGIIPIIVFFPIVYILSLIPAILFFFIYIFYLNKKIGGYTGDCCGALFLISELLIYVGVYIISFIMM